MEHKFQVGQRIRAYDYNPREVFDELEFPDGVFTQGKIVELINIPFLGYKIICEESKSGVHEPGEIVCIAEYLASHDFHGRVIAV